MVSTKTLIEIHNLSVRFGRQVVLRAIDLTLPRGQTLAIIGESGCGKTVLLKTMIGLVQPTTGEVLFDTQRLADLNEKELTRQRMRFAVSENRLRQDAAYAVWANNMEQHQ